MKEIILFKKALKASNVDFAETNSVASKKGFLIHPDCCNTRVLDWLNTLPVNYNSTFYKSWKDVTSKNRMELFNDQIAHYMSTYGTDFKGTPYIPNDNPAVVAYEQYQVILPITEEEIEQKIQGMLGSGIAMSQDTIETCLSLLAEFNINIDINKVKNKEAMMILCKKLGKLPTKEEEMVRYLVYNYTEKTLLIKSRDVINSPKEIEIRLKSMKKAAMVRPMPIQKEICNNPRLTKAASLPRSSSHELIDERRISTIRLRFSLSTPSIKTCPVKMMEKIRAILIPSGIMESRKEVSSPARVRFCSTTGLVTA